MSIGYPIYWAASPIDGAIYVSIYPDLLKGIIAFGTSLWAELVTSPLPLMVPDEYKVISCPDICKFKNLAEAHHFVPAIPTEFPVKYTNPLAILYYLYKPDTHWVVFSWDPAYLTQSAKGNNWSESIPHQQVVDKSKFSQLICNHVYVLDQITGLWPELKFSLKTNWPSFPKSLAGYPPEHVTYNPAGQWVTTSSDFTLGTHPPYVHKTVPVQVAKFHVAETFNGEFILLYPSNKTSVFFGNQAIKSLKTIQYTGDSLETVKLGKAWPSLDDMVKGAFEGTYKLEGEWFDNGTYYSFESHKVISEKYYYVNLINGGVAFFLNPGDAQLWEFKYPSLVDKFQSSQQIEELQSFDHNQSLKTGVVFSDFAAAGVLEPDQKLNTYWFLWEKKQVVFFATPLQQFDHFKEYTKECGDQPAALKYQTIMTTKKLDCYPGFYSDWTHTGVPYPASIPSPKFDASVAMATKLQNVFYMKGKQGQIVLFESKLTHFIKTLRKKYPAKFKSCRVKLRTIHSDWLGLGGFGHEGVLYNKIYDSWNDVVNAGVEYASKVGQKKTKTSPATVAAELVVERPFEPMKGDYVQLYVDGRLTEDFTFVSALIREESDAYVVLDIYGNELAVEPLSERDNQVRKAWRQYLPQTTTH